MKEVSDCHILVIKIKKLVPVIYPTNASTADLDSTLIHHVSLYFTLTQLL